MFILLQGGFLISEVFFGCDNLTYNPSPVWIEAVSSIFRHYSPAVLSLGEEMQGGLPSVVLSMTSDGLTYNPSLSNS